MELIEPLARGTLVTVILTLASSLVAVIVATLMGFAKLSSYRTVRWPAIGYIEFFRGSSILVQLFWLYFVLPQLGVRIDPYVVGVLGIGMNAGAYGAEIVRSAIQAVPKGQYEAAIALNMSGYTRFMRVIGPQALVIMLPSWGNQFINILKSTSLVSLITIHDLTFVGITLNAVTYQTLEIFLSILAIYYVLGRLVIAPGMLALERRAKIGIYGRS